MISKTKRKPAPPNTYCCNDCCAVLHSNTELVCLCCNGTSLRSAIINDLYNADKKTAKFRDIIGLERVDEKERRVNKKANSLRYYKQWKRSKKCLIPIRKFAN